MLTGLAMIRSVPPGSLPYAWVFIVVVILLIVVVFVRLYGRGNQSSRAPSHHGPARDKRHGQRPRARRRHGGRT
jgi:hypothetical protein